VDFLNHPQRRLIEHTNGSGYKKYFECSLIEQQTIWVEQFIKKQKGSD